MNRAKRVTWEGLEARRLLSTSIQLSGGTLLVRGTAGADVIEVSQLPPGGATPLGTPQPSLFVTINGRTRRLDAGSIRSVRVEAGGGDDWVAMGENPFVTGIREAVVTIRQELPATILGGTGNDTLIGGDGNDSMSGGGGCDFLEAGGGDDTVDGDANGDTLEGDAGADLIRGGNGDDRFTIDADDHVFGGAGTDFYAQVPSSGPGVLNVIGGVLPNVLETEGSIGLQGAPAPDVLIEGDTLVVRGTRRADQITIQNSILGDHSLTVYVNDRLGNRSVSLTPNAGIKRIRVEGGDGDDDIEVGPETRVNAVFIPEFVPVSQDLVLVGGNGNDTLIGGDGRDTLLGGAGDDVLAGGDADDTLDGGDGFDTLRGNAGANQLLNGESQA